MKGSGVSNHLRGNTSKNLKHKVKRSGWSHKFTIIWSTREFTQFSCLFTIWLAHPTAGQMSGKDMSNACFLHFLEFSKGCLLLVREETVPFVFVVLLSAQDLCHFPGTLNPFPQLPFLTFSRRKYAFNSLLALLMVSSAFSLFSAVKTPSLDTGEAHGLL